MHIGMSVAENDFFMIHDKDNFYQAVIDFVQEDLNSEVIDKDEDKEGFYIVQTDPRYEILHLYYKSLTHGSSLFSFMEEEHQLCYIFFKNQICDYKGLLAVERALREDANIFSQLSELSDGEDEELSWRNIKALLYEDYQWDAVAPWIPEHLTSNQIKSMLVLLLSCCELETIRGFFSTFDLNEDEMFFMWDKAIQLQRDDVFDCIFEDEDLEYLRPLLEDWEILSFPSNQFKDYLYDKVFQPVPGIKELF